MANVVIIENFINGAFVACPSSIESINPATGDCNARVPDSGKKQVDAAVTAALAAYPRYISGMKTL